MPTIQISEEQLTKRISRIPRLLKPLTSIRPACGFYHGMAGKDTRIIGAHQGDLSDHYRNWRFSTFVSDYRCMYFEFWKSDNGRDFYLVNMSLSIFKIDRTRHDESELLALHCEPEEPDNSKHAKYKRGPHIHVTTAESPLPHAHLTLTCGYLDDILSSYESLMEAIGWAIVMLKEQILEQSAD